MSNTILISYKQLETYVKGYNLNKETFGEYRASGVKGSLIESLLQIWEKVKDNPSTDIPSFWKKQTRKQRLARVFGQSIIHKWFQKYEDGNVHYDVGTYGHDGWATAIIGDILAAYDDNKLGGWLSEQKDNDEISERIRVVLGYYKAEGNYFSRVIETYRSKGVISEGDYRRVCANKYADKVWEAHSAEPRFNVGDRVFLRSNTPSVRGNNGYHRAPNGAIVLSNSEAVISAAKGAKRYKLLPFGHVEPFLAEERQLKKRQ